MSDTVAAPEAPVEDAGPKTVVSFQHVSIVFGDNPWKAIPLMETGQSRADIQKETGQVLGVHDCSLDVAEGEILVLMGLSGSGKSTLLRAVNGLNPIVQGDVLVHDGKDMVSVPKASAKVQRQICTDAVAMVFQQFGLLPWRTVRDNVGFGLELAGIKRRERNRRVDEQLALVGLSQWAERKVGELSGGMQQRVGLARAFATNAPILLMDEPFSALDPLIRTRLQDELLDLQQRLKRTIIFVSHDLDEAFKIGNRIAIMEGGRIIQCGTPAEIYTRPANAYVAEFVAHMNPLGVLTARDAMVPAPRPAPTGLTLPANTPLRDAMISLSDARGRILLTESGQVVGMLTDASAVAALVAKRGDETASEEEA
ncbi:choline ABC transporter ATP-binding protein [Pararhodobacter zhoushanensis]|uniref:choline ABC transporter ATP-binding protein n=1 Tax=Pararhodobacter zhoushanensis TaxID=2479545 RepID=UPI000F8D28BC|nr:choline ABC transporter ATP-binding protein [Pararhodobacter zhoushanensis]